MIYWLTGPIGAGKSTLGAALASRLPETDFIDGDFCLVQNEDIPFETRINEKKKFLVKIALSYAENNHSLIIAYPLTKETAKSLKDDLARVNGQLIIIAVEPPYETITRAYSDWEKNRKSAMQEVNGKGYADILFTHPTSYLYDSVNKLIGMLMQKR